LGYTIKANIYCCFCVVSDYCLFFSYRSRFFLPWGAHLYIIFICSAVLFSDSFISSQVNSQVVLSIAGCGLRASASECLAFCIANNHNNWPTTSGEQPTTANNHIVGHMAGGMGIAVWDDPPCWLPNKPLTIKCTIAIRPKKGGYAVQETGYPIKLWFMSGNLV